MRFPKRKRFAKPEGVVFIGKPPFGRWGAGLCLLMHLYFNLDAFVGIKI
jgi:hypothetical protein